MINKDTIIPDLRVSIYTKGKDVYFKITGFDTITEAEAYALIQHQTLNIDLPIQPITETIH